MNKPSLSLALPAILQSLLKDFQCSNLRPSSAAVLPALQRRVSNLLYPRPEYIMRNAGLGEAQAGIKIAGRNINNLRYADDTTLMEESEEETIVIILVVKIFFVFLPPLLNILSRLVIAFFPRSKCLLFSWLQLPSAVILEHKKIVCHCFHYFPIYLP